MQLEKRATLAKTRQDHVWMLHDSFDLITSQDGPQNSSLNISKVDAQKQVSTKRFKKNPGDRITITNISQHLLPATSPTIFSPPDAPGLRHLDQKVVQPRSSAITRHQGPTPVASGICCEAAVKLPNHVGLSQPDHYAKMDTMTRIAKMDLVVLYTRLYSNSSLKNSASFAPLAPFKGEMRDWASNIFAKKYGDDVAQTWDLFRSKGKFLKNQKKKSVGLAPEAQNPASKGAKPGKTSMLLLTATTWCLLLPNLCVCQETRIFSIASRGPIKARAQARLRAKRQRTVRLLNMDMFQLTRCLGHGLLRFVFTSRCFRYTSYTCSLVSVSFNIVHTKPPFSMKESMCLSFAGVNPLMFGTATANMSTLTRLPALIHCMIPHVLLHGQLCCRTTNAGTWAWQAILHRWGKIFPKKRLLRRNICAMTPWLHDPDLSRSQTSLQTAPRSCALKSHTSTRCGMISPPHSPTKKTHCEVSTSEPAQEVSLHLTGDNSWNCLSLLLLCHGCGWTSWSAGYPNVFGSRKDLMLIVHKMSPSLCTQKGTLQKHRIRMMFISVQLTSSKSLRELVRTV